MIFVCEPCVTGQSHEKVNSAFLSCVRLAYPAQRIRFFADPTHITAIKDIAALDAIDLSSIEYIAFPVRNSESPSQFLRYRRQLKRLFEQALENGVRRILFLSANPAVQLQAKRLQATPAFISVELCFVLHAAFEAVATDHVAPLPVRPLPAGRRRVFELARERGWGAVAGTVARVTLAKLDIVAWIWKRWSDRFLGVRRVMEWRHSNRVRYIALSPHVVANARRYLDPEALNIRAVVLPTVFRNYPPHVSADHPRFAVFGYGNSPMLHTILEHLARIRPARPYEIRIIGMDNRGTSGFPNVVAASPGKFMARSEMEKHVADIDMFLILYDRSRYRLSCSNAILEALSYSKPILHLTNDCVAFFNRPDAPIGYEAGDAAAYAQKMSDIIDNYAALRGDLATFGYNVAALREKYRIDNQLAAFRLALEG